MQTLDFLILLFEYLIFFYCLFIMTSYLIMSAISFFAIRRYHSKDVISDHQTILTSPLQPSISIIAPAFNEEVTIVDNIRSLLLMHYSNLTVIVVNDGSKDDTLKMAIEAYDLEPINQTYSNLIETKPIRGIYKSTNPAWKKLIIVDKENGGKSDALNVGINICTSEYFACIDVDCILEPNAFLKLVSQVILEPKKRVIAVGGMVWLTNGSQVVEGKLTELRAPDEFIARMQVLEYCRAFLMGRTAWSTYNGLMLISGAFGLFDTQLVKTVGGYNTKTVGEDMELVIRMHKYMRERKLPYKVAYIPDPLCWTEAPSDGEILGRQRNRWTRGTIECLWIHRNMFFNPKYGILGWLSYPYWFFAEWLAAFIEAGGYIFVFIVIVFKLINWKMFIALSIFVYCFAVFLTIFSLLTQQLVYRKFINFKDILKLCGTAFLEPFLYHPRTVWWAIKGNYDKVFKNNHAWGAMTRKGFATKK